MNRDSSHRPKGALPASLLSQEYVIEGRSCKEIGERHNRSDWGILYWLRKYGIPSRSRIESANMPRRTERMRPKISGPNNYGWKGGRELMANGYVAITKFDHPGRNCNNKIYEHRLMAERKLGRSLLRHELVHHINGIKTDNRPENLMVCYGMKDHCRFHKRSHQKNGQK